MKILISLTLIFFAPLVAAKEFKTEKWTTTQGTPVVFYQAMEVPMIDISIAFAAGSAVDGNQFGIAALTNNLINKGNAGLDTNTIAENLEVTGAQYETSITRDMSVLSLRSLSQSESLQQAIFTFTQIVTQPDFPDASFEREKKQQLLAIRQTQESPNDVANQVFFKALYQNHPYAHPINGTQDKLQQITKAQVKAFYHQYYVANNAVMVIVGAVDSQTAHKLSEQITKNLPKGKMTSSIPKASPLAKDLSVSVNYPSAQTFIRIGQIGIDHHNPDYFPLMVGNYVLGGNQLNSILASEIRASRGLTYSISSQFSPMPAGGPFIIGLSTQNAKADEALTTTKNLLLNYIKKGPSEEELNITKQYMTGNFPLSLSSNRGIANILLRMSFFHLPDDFLENYVKNIHAVRTQQIKTAFQKYLNPNAFLTIIVGPE